MNSYPLSGNVQSPFCRGYWDNDKKKFFTSNSTDVIQCCLNSCKDRINYCFDTCNKNYGPQGKAPDYDKNKACFNRCAELINDCESGCLEISSDGLKIITDCAEENNCGKYPLFKKECLQGKKQDIITCCKTKCLTDQSIDCEGDLCGNFYEQLVNKVQYPNSKIPPEYRLNKSDYQDDKKEPMIAVYIILILVFVLGVYIIFKLN